MFLKTLLICGMCVTYIQNSNGQKTLLPKPELKLVSVMFRHGDRAPEQMEFDFVPELATNDTYQPVGLGQLTNQGKLRLYNNGVMARKMYNQFLGNIVADGNIVVYPTNYSRTGASALAFLAGLFPPAKEQQWTPACKTTEVTCLDAWKPELATLWNPIPYVYNQSIIDEMISFYVSCPPFFTEMRRVERLPEFQEKFNNYDALFKYVTLNTDVQIGRQKETILYIVGLLIAKTRIGEELPAWAVPVWNELLEVTELVFQMTFHTNKQKRLSCGSIAQRILNDMVAKAAGSLQPNNRKLIIYSAHDLTVASLYGCFGGIKGFVDLNGNPAPVNYPKFGATLFIELYLLPTNKYAVKILYHNFKADEPQMLKLVDCEEFCSLDKFKALIQPTTLSRAKQIAACSKS